MSDTMKAKADLSNWRESPQNQWSFINIDKVLKTDLIKKSAHPSVLETQRRSFEDFSIDVRGAKLNLAQYLSESTSDGFIILQHGKILFEEYAHGNDVHSKHILMSMTKSVTGLVVGILQGQGKLHVDDPVTKYVPELGGSLYKDVTIRQCIDMRSGAKYLDGTHEYRYATGWTPGKGGEKYHNLHDFLVSFRVGETETLELSEDDRFEYVSVNTDVMGWVVERVAGKKFAEVVEELVWEPMGAESDAWMATDREGSVRAAGGLCATLRDVARLGQLVLESGRDIVPSGWVNDLIGGGDRVAFAKSTWAGFHRVFPNLAYRSYWLGDGDADMAIAMGIHGQLLFVDRRNDVVVAKTGSQAEGTDIGRTAMAMLAFMEIQRILLTT